MRKKLTCCIDIGGTKIAWGLLNTSQELIKIEKMNSVVGLQNVSSTVEKCILAATSESQKRDTALNPHIYIGCGGNYLSDGTLAKGSCEILAAVPGEWDGVNVADTFNQALGKDYHCQVVNDGIAQFHGAVYLNPPEQSIKLAYVGPGTGLAGGFGRIDESGKLSIYTDGHIFDMYIKTAQGDAKQAEDLFSGRAYKKTTGKTPKEAESLPEFHKPYIHIFADYLAQIIANIYFASFKKASPWPRSDLQTIKGTSTIYLGGGMGSESWFSTQLLKTTRFLLAQAGLGHIKIKTVEDSVQAALIGAYLSQV